MKPTSNFTFSSVFAVAHAGLKTVILVTQNLNQRVKKNLLHHTRIIFNDRRVHTHKLLSRLLRQSEMNNHRGECCINNKYCVDSQAARIHTNLNRK